MKASVHIRIEVEASDTEMAIRKAIWRIWEVRSSDVISDRFPDIDREIEWIEEMS